MTDDWPQGWYQDEKPHAGEPTRDAPIQAAPGAYGSTGFGSTGFGNGGYGDRGYGSGGTAGGWPTQPPANAGQGSGPGYGGGSYRGGGAGTRRRRRWLRPRRILLVLAALVLVLVVALGFLYVNINGKLNRANVLTDYSGRPAPTAGTNWLIAGSDSRGGLSRTEEDQFALGNNVTGGRSDTIMILHIPANGATPTLVSIPRDSYVPIPGHGENKINAAYAIGGPKLLAETVQNVTGLYISHYIGIGFGGLVDAVNSVGGVRLCLPAAYKDPLAGLNLPKGCQNLNGEQVLAFSRTRNFSLGDLQREQDQRLVLSALLEKMTSPGTMFNPFASIPAAYSIAGTLDVDSGTQLINLYSVGEGLRNPVSTSVPFGSFENTSVGSVVTWNTSQARELFGDLATDKPIPKSLLTGTSLEGTA
ncbi:MAG TPA: LCP family protein [Trebonia sp.]|jgi:LCP family protein required for cell wall assembly|nr:LCP family protein [Trebonia sp.]